MTLAGSGMRSLAGADCAMASEVSIKQTIENHKAASRMMEETPAQEVAQTKANGCYVALG